MPLTRAAMNANRPCEHSTAFGTPTSGRLAPAYAAIGSASSSVTTTSAGSTPMSSPSRSGR